IVNSDSTTFLKHNTEKFDLVFLDPPFGKELLEETLDQLPPHLSEDAVIYIEQEAKSSFTPASDQWQQLKFKKTSSFSYALYRLI
ncbi:MAG: RsmD family RNA methyltransferase, partial [Kangiellaceae bacterium]|nr:RsmD family RNA methyltransferase [Kangiellaceae bacterium]